MHGDLVKYQIKREVTVGATPIEAPKVNPRYASALAGLAAIGIIAAISVTERSSDNNQVIDNSSRAKPVAEATIEK